MSKTFFGTYVAVTALAVLSSSVVLASDHRKNAPTSTQKTAPAAAAATTTTTPPKLTGAEVRDHRQENTQIRNAQVKASITDKDRQVAVDNFNAAATAFNNAWISGDKVAIARAQTEVDRQRVIMAAANKKNNEALSVLVKETKADNAAHPKPKTDPEVHKQNVAKAKAEAQQRLGEFKGKVDTAHNEMLRTGKNVEWALGDRERARKSGDKAAYAKAEADLAGAQAENKEAGLRWASAKKNYDLTLKNMDRYK